MKKLLSYPAFNINASDARKNFVFPNEYIVRHTIPDLVRKMRKLVGIKGEHRTRMSKAIDTMIELIQTI